MIFEAAKNSEMSNERVTVIKPKTGWQVIGFKELIAYKDLFYFLVWRDVKVMYAQTILGFSWAILSPLIQIVIFTIIFGKSCQSTHRRNSLCFVFKRCNYPLVVYVKFNGRI